MKEVLSRSFWQGVKKTLYEAMESPPAKEDALPNPAAEQGNASSSKENSSSPSPGSEEQLGQ